MNINDITMGMTPQEKEIYFKHQEKRCLEEAERVETEKERLKTQRAGLIEDILKDRNDFTREELAKMPARTLERILEGGWR